MITRYTMGSWLYFPIHCRRPDRNCTSQLITGYRAPRHILCRSPFPLCPIYRSRICHYRRLRPLIPTIHWLYARLNLSKNPLPHHVRRGKYDLLPSTFPRTIWNAPTILRLPRRLYDMKHSILYRVIHLTHSSNPNSVYSMRGLRIKTRSINSRTYNNQPRMNAWMSPTLPHIRRTYLRKPKIRKEGIEPPHIGFKPTSYPLCLSPPERY